MVGVGRPVKIRLVAANALARGGCVAAGVALFAGDRGMRPIERETGYGMVRELRRAPGGGGVAHGAFGTEVAITVVRIGGGIEGGKVAVDTNH